jgi:hypothetical protein
MTFGERFKTGFVVQLAEEMQTLGDDAMRTSFRVEDRIGGNAHQALGPSARALPSPAAASA